MAKLTCFKAYDVRGELGEDFNIDIAYRIGRAYGQHLRPETVVIGGDARLSTAEIKSAICQGLMDAGVNVIDLGLTGTEEIYFAVQHLKVDGGLEVTASHNPANYNGIKFVGLGARPIGKESGLTEIRLIAESGQFEDAEVKGILTNKSYISAYVDYLLSYISPENIRPMRIVANSGNGAAGHIVDALENRFSQLAIPIEFIKIDNEPNGDFPNGVPNPMLVECRKATSIAVREHQADLGIAWDGDFDRCFFFDEKGQFIESYYIVGLLAELFLYKHEGATIIHDSRLSWNTIDIVKAAGGVPVQSKAGHTYIKQAMRNENAVYGGEMSGHHYFRDFAYCDSGMIPWLVVAELLSIKKIPLSRAIGERVKAFPSSGEINTAPSLPDRAISRVRDKYQLEAITVDETDGISLEFDDWRFSLRQSNTENLVRLNIEARYCADLVKKKADEIITLLSETTR